MTSVEETTIRYETDFVRWVDQTAQFLRERRFDALDIENLIDEVEDLSRREREALFNNLKVVLMHLLKWQFQTNHRSNSWRASIVEHRQRTQRQFKQAPSLKPHLEKIYLECYQDARILAAAETGLKLTEFPLECPYNVAEILDQNFFPAS